MAIRLSASDKDAMRRVVDLLDQRQTYCTARVIAAGSKSRSRWVEAMQKATIAKIEVARLRFNQRLKRRSK